MAVVERLVAELGFKIETKKLENFRDKVDGLKTSIRKISTVAAGTAAGLFALTKVGSNQAERLGYLAKQAGITIEAYQELGHAASQAGSNQQEMGAALDNLNKKMQDVSIGRDKGAIEAFSILGLSPSAFKNADELLLGIADRFQTLRNESARRIALGGLGISENLIPLLEQGSTGIRQMREEARKRGGILSKEDFERSKDLNNSLRNLGESISSIRNIIVTELSPSIKSTVEAIDSWITANKELIGQNIEAFINGIRDSLSFLVDAFKPVISFFKDLIESITGVENAAYGLGILFTGSLAIRMGMFLNSLLALNPHILALATAFLAIKDVINFIKGEDSNIGSTLGGFESTMFSNVKDSLQKRGINNFEDLGISKDGFLGSVAEGLFSSGNSPLKKTLPTNANALPHITAMNKNNSSSNERPINQTNNISFVVQDPNEAYENLRDRVVGFFEDLFGEKVMIATTNNTTNVEG